MHTYLCFQAEVPRFESRPVPQDFTDQAQIKLNFDYRLLAVLPVLITLSEIDTICYHIQILRYSYGLDLKNSRLTDLNVRSAAIGDITTHEVVILPRAN